MNAVMNARVVSQVQTARELCEQSVAMVIPCYQRPYVWPSEDVIKLLDDIVAAYEAREPHYYIGTVLSALVKSPQDKNGKPTAQRCYELIDGQQRMTTLMLLALAFRDFIPGHALSELVSLGKQPRLTFAVRDQVQEMLGYWANLEDFHSPGEDAIEDNPYLKHLHGAYRVARSRVKAMERVKDEGYLEQVGQFIYQRVKWVNNTMPRGMDLNRLFATMNTSGVQLEQTDILKSLLLKKITDAKEKQVYDAIWQACENMNNYFERNVRQLFPDADWQNLTFDQLAKYNSERFDLSVQGEKQGKGFTIAELAERPFKESPDKTEAADDDNEIYCRSIISFSLLLMHAYRIFLHKRKQDDISVRLRDTRLSECFEELLAEKNNGESAKAFIECLWQVRYQFDRWVVKWVEQADDDREYLRLSRVSVGDSKGKSYLTRSVRETSNLSQLQSLRNFTGERNAQYWLTPFLGRLTELKLSKDKPTKQVRELLDSIDNQLSIAEETQKIASYKLLTGKSIAISEIQSVCDDLAIPQGTAFEHYWFQKVEYLLWRKRKTFDFFDEHKLQQYRIASRNSVEHVHPQNEEYNRSLKKKVLDSFGNLVLLSPGENSSYSNQAVLKKRVDFKSKPTYDSLKLAHIFHSISDANDWNTASIQSHQEAMLNLIKAHYGKQG